MLYRFPLGLTTQTCRRTLIVVGGSDAGLPSIVLIVIDDVRAERWMAMFRPSTLTSCWSSTRRPLLYTLRHHGLVY